MLYIEKSLRQQPKKLLINEAVNHKQLEKNLDKAKDLQNKVQKAAAAEKQYLVEKNFRLKHKIKKRIHKIQQINA